MATDPNGTAWWDWLAGALAIVGIALVAVAVAVVTCGVGTALAGTMAGAIVYGAAQGVLVGATISVVSGGLIGVQLLFQDYLADFSQAQVNGDIIF